MTTRQVTASDPTPETTGPAQTPGNLARQPFPTRVRRLLLVGLMLFAVLLPLVPLLIWSVAGQWRYPALLPQQLSLRGLELLVDPRSDILQGLATSV
ncbi:MAG: hypothetical protein ABJD68_20525, partial [Nakamurella sp.]